MGYQWGRCLRLLGTLLLVAAPACLASGLQVAPIGLQLRHDAQAEALWLSNTGDTLVHAQIRVFHWTQLDDKDHLEPSRGLLISPPMLSLAPGQRQLVRVIRSGPPPAEQEDAYRIVVDELPLSASAARGGLQFVLRYSIPVFLQPLSPARAGTDLHSRWRDGPEGSYLQVSNRGKTHAQLAELYLRDAQGNRTLLKPGLLGYALPGSHMEWVLPATQRPVGSALLVRINGEATEHTLALDDDHRR
jgi:fimbrial chaperone protein